MNREDYEYLLDEFIRMCPYVDGYIQDWYVTDDREIIVILTDGSAYRYDYLTKTYRKAPSVEELDRKVDDEKSWRMEFAKRLYRKMVIEGFTQDELAWRSNMSPATITKYVNGIATPTVYRLMLIANALGCTVDELIYFD